MNYAFIRSQFYLVFLWDWGLDRKQNKWLKRNQRRNLRKKRKQRKVANLLQAQYSLVSNVDVSTVTYKKRKRFHSLCVSISQPVIGSCHGFSYQNTAAGHLGYISRQPSKYTPLKVLREHFGNLKLEASSVYWI